MKKLFNGRFLFILASSLVVLILLTVGAFYLFDDEEDKFVKSGYVLNPLNATAEKYFFDENASYKENLSSMVEFKDVDKNTVTILRDSFVHYMDESMSFLKNGAILDLDSVSGNKAVSFYNITDKSIIEKTDDGYVIESANGDIKLKNFVGRISDDKYIVVGDLNLKMAGNSTTIKGDYFEIVYVEEGIVNIENKSVKYQVTADDTLIYVGNDKVIDLGDKKISADDEDIMSITSITINGNENIEIVPKAEEDDNPGGGAGGDGTGDGTGTGSGSGGGGGGSGSGEGDGDGTGGGTGSGDGEGGTGDAGIDGEEPDNLTVSLKEVSIGSTNVDVIFDVINASEDDVLKLQVVNLNSGRTVDMVAQVLADAEIQVNLLTPNTKYLFMVINEKDNAKYFQKVFETTGFGIKLEKSYATDNALAYKVTVEEGTDITNAKLSLYKYNEETKQNEIVTTSYYDTETGETKYVEKVTYLSSIEGNLEGEHEIIYDGLENNTIYTAVLDEFSVASSNFKDIYNITLTSMTLKATPKFSEMTITKDVGQGSFDLSLGNITDPDNAITSYTYMIYDKFDDTLAIDPIIKTNASPITVKVGSENNQLKNDTNYYYKVIIEYFDNEKYIEYVTTDSITFVMGDDPYITVVPNDDLISYDKIGATIYLIDNSCLISIPGREKCGENSSAVVEVRKVDALGNIDTIVYRDAAKFEVNGKEIKADLFVENLEAGTTYNIEVKAIYNNSQDQEAQEILHTDESKRKITTKSLTSFTADWVDMGSSANHVVNVQNKFLGDENSGTLSPEESAASIKKVEIKLYEGGNVADIENKLPIATKSFLNTDEFNIKENFYDNGYTITTDETFGLTMEALKALGTDEKLSEYYTITINAYYDTAGKNMVKLNNNILSYKISPILLMDNIVDPTLEVTSYITHSSSGKIFSNLTNDGTVVGYTLLAGFDRAGLLLNKLEPKKINFYVYNAVTREKVKFYVKDENGKLTLVDRLSDNLGESGFYETTIYMGYGTAYENVDDVMVRGNSFYIGYEIETDSNGETLLYPVSKDDNSPSDYGYYIEEEAEKETPKLQMYIAKSTENSITYEYAIKDPDNAIYKEADSDNYGFYTKVNDGEEIKLNLTKVNADYNKFEGRLTIDELSNGNLYSLYYKKNNLKSGVFENDVVNYLDGEDTGLRMFDGYYDAKEEQYNFKYQIINNPLVDNKAIIKILASEDMLSRILSYQVNLVDSRGNKLDLELWKLSSCEGDEEGTLARCLSLDYGEIVNMKSNQDEVNLIKVTVTAIYDNGLVGYDYKVGSSEEDDFMYCIMQDNNTELGYGSYVSFSSSGKQISVWSEKLGAPKGYYTYTLNKQSGSLYYKSQLNTSHRSYIDVDLSSTGYSSNYGVLNPKMVSVENMSCLENEDGSACNTFSFSSITPRVSVSEKAAIINGSVQNFTLGGVDLNDLKNEGTEANPEYYLYIETWRNSNYIGDFDRTSRPTIKVKLDSSNPTGKTVSATIDGLLENNTYYFNVYAYMYKNGKVTYTQLFDAGITDSWETKTYQFTSLKPSDVFHNFDVNYSSSTEIYGNRQLDTKINLLAYKNNVAFNFDIVYILCDVDDVTCGPNEGNTNIFRKEIPLEDISTGITDAVDISEFDLEFDKNYYMYIYANVKLYNLGTEESLIEYNIDLNRYSINVKLRKLVEPSFVVTRNAVLENGEYAVDFNIMVSDPDRTLENGNYFIKLLDENGNLSGNMQLLDEEGNYYSVPDYDKYAFDAFIINKKVRITGLEEDTKYTIIVYNDAYLNNYDAATLPGRENRTKYVEKTYTVYSTNNYGVAFGRDILYSATEKSIIVTFLGGSNFDNVTEVTYTYKLYDSNQNSGNTGGTTAGSKGGTFVIGENNKYFEIYKNSEDWVFVIDPSDMKNELGRTYNVTLSFKVKIPGTDGEYVVLTSADNDKFEGKAQYVEDEK